MNYRHIFHAGNICDVVKHVVLTLALDHLRAKDKAFFVLDTHAGIGRYDLNNPNAQKTGEAQGGVMRLMENPPIAGLTSYYNALRELNPHARKAKDFIIYPGSPLLAQSFLRPDDRMVACEAHPEDAQILRRTMYIYPNIHVHHRDGYEALRAFLPPQENRGLVLIDPPYEHPDEFDMLTRHFIEAYRRWPQGIFMLWYPIKERPAIWRFQERLAATGIAKLLCAEFIYQEETRHDRLNGSGLVIASPPWQLAEKLQQVFQELHVALQTEHRGVNVKWLAA